MQKEQTKDKVATKSIITKETLDYLYGIQDSIVDAIGVCPMPARNYLLRAEINLNHAIHCIHK